MIYIYDILLNWTDTDKIYEFFEWEANDMIEHIKRIPLLRVSEDVINQMTSHLIEVPATLLKDIYHKTEVHRQKACECLEYAALFTDCKRAIAIEFDETGRSMYRSFMLLDEEEEILDVAERLEEESLSYQVLEENEDTVYCTRKEEMMKHYLLKEINYTYQHHNYQKMHYLYTEYCNEEENDVDAIYEKFINSLENSFTEGHKRLYQLLKLSHTKKQV